MKNRIAASLEKELENLSHVMAGLLSSAYLMRFIDGFCRGEEISRDTNKAETYYVFNGNTNQFRFPPSGVTDLVVLKLAAMKYLHVFGNELNKSLANIDKINSFKNRSVEVTQVVQRLMTAAAAVSVPVHVRQSTPQTLLLPSDPLVDYIVIKPREELAITALDDLQMTLRSVQQTIDDNQNRWGFTELQVSSMNEQFEKTDKALTHSRLVLTIQLVAFGESLSLGQIAQVKETIDAIAKLDLSWVDQNLDNLIKECAQEVIHKFEKVRIDAEQQQLSEVRKKAVLDALFMLKLKVEQWIQEHTSIS